MTSQRRPGPGSGPGWGRVLVVGLIVVVALAALAGIAVVIIGMIGLRRGGLVGP